MGFYFGFATELAALAVMGAVQWRLGNSVNSFIKQRLPPVPARMLSVAVRIVVAALTLGLILSLPNASRLPLTRFLSERDFARVVDAANGLRAHVMFVTGDLISVRGDPLDACLDQIARLRADAGVLGCLGNHEVYARTEEYTTMQAARMGVLFLRG